MIKLLFILCIFLIPGILIINKKYDFLKNLLYIIMFSLSFWIISAWFLKLFNFSLLSFFYIISILSLIGFLFKLKIKIKKDWMILIFIIILFLRLIPFFTLTAQPLSGDATFHALTAKLIVENDGLVNNYEPLLPVSIFGLYVPGFHTISALISLLSGMEVYRSTLLFSCIIYFLIIFLFYVFLRDYFKKGVSLITALIAGFLTTYPQMIFHWGGNPTALGFLFMFTSFLILKNIDKKISVKKLLLAVFFIVGGFLSHSNPFLVFFYIVAFYSFFLILNKKWIVLRNGVYLFFFFFLLVIPFFLSVGFDLSYTKEESFGMELGELRHSIATKNLLFLIPIQAVGYTSLLLTLLVFGGWLIMKKDRNWIKYTAFLFFIMILIVNSKYKFLLFSDIMLHLDRLSLFFFIPFLYFSAGFIKKINKRILGVLIVLFLVFYSIYIINIGEINFENSPYNVPFQERSKITIKESINAVLFQHFGTVMLYTFGFKDEVVLTQSDLEAMEWIKKNTDQNDLFLNNAYDAGKWIPAIAYRPILKPHVGIIYGKEVDEYYNMKDFKIDYYNLKERNVKYVYIGKKYNFRQELKPEMFENEDYLKVYDKDGVKIYKVVY